MFRSHRQNAAAGLFGLAMAFGASSALAGEAIYLSNDASRCEIFRGLNRDVPPECELPAGMKTRSIRLHNQPDSLATPQGTQSVAATENDFGTLPSAAPAAPAPQNFSIAMRIQFEYDSYRLTSEARSTLDGVALVLNDDLMQGKQILVEGHADATGSDAYNFDLSALRAQAVKDYLIDVHGIDRERLQALGKGETDLYDLSNPTAGINRRVEFTTLSD
jgi:outer membrane protein OmpA-like peptidoglycan-associated protein